MHVSFLPSLAPAALLRGRHHLDPGALLFGRSRQALAASLPALGLKAGDVVLAPASLCWDALEPLLAFGLTVRCYPLDSTLKLEFAAMQALADANTRAVLVVHYYGFAQDIAPVRAWCDTQGLKLIEDCALCLYDGAANGGVGSTGDIATFSLWKFLPVPDGAVLLTHAAVELPSGAPAPALARLLRLLAAYLAARGLFPLGAIRRLRRPAACARPQGVPEMPRPKLMSNAARRIWSNCDSAAVASTRRANYRVLAAALAGAPGIALVHPELGRDTVPFALLVRCADPVALQQCLLRQGFETELPINRFFAGIPGVEGQAPYPAIDALADHVLALPVHQDMTPRQVAKLGRAVRACAI